MRSGLVISGLLHTALLYVLLTEPLHFEYLRPDRAQPLVEFTTFDVTTPIEVEQALAEEETEVAEVEEPEPSELSEAAEEAELAEEPLPEEEVEEIAQDEALAEPEPEALAESETEPEPVEEIAEEAAEESEPPVLAEADAPLELPPLLDEPEALPESVLETLPEPELETALAEPAEIQAGTSEAAEAQPVEAPVDQVTAAVDDTPPPLAAAPLEPEAVPSEALVAEETPEPATAEDPLDTIELATSALTAPSLLPSRRPESIAELPPLDLPAPAPEAPAEQESQFAANETPSNAPTLPRDLTTQYQPQWTGRVAGQQLLDNLALVRDEEAQARANPELWEVVRLLRQQVKECWRLGRPGLDNPDFVVEMEVRIQRSGAVQQAHILDVSQMVDDQDFAEFARNARASLVRCSPYALPEDRYALWGDLVVRFLARGQGIAGR